MSVSRASIDPIALKDFLPFLPLLAAIFLYWEKVRDRQAWVKKKKARFKQLGTTCTFVMTWPNAILSVVMMLAVTSSLAYLFYRLAGSNAPTTGLAHDLLKLNYDWFLFILFLWLPFAIAAYFNLLSRLFAELTRLAPSSRRTIGWANAGAHLRLGNDAPAIALGANGDAVADDVLTVLASSPRNKDMALRPEGLSDEEAANILYFGHVIELHFTRNRPDNRTGWTAFYEILAALANAPDRPFSAASIASYAGRSFFFDVVKRFDKQIPKDENGVAAGVPLPDDIRLETMVDDAFEALQTKFGGDARNVGKGLLGYSYRRALARIGAVVDDDALRLQFGKLAIVWGIWGAYPGPKAFRIPFSSGIALYFLEKEYLITDAENFRTDDALFRGAVEEAEQKLLEKAYQAVTETNNPAVAAWRDEERSRAEKVGADWRWFVLYRVDQQLYSLSRGFDAKGWRFQEGGNLIARAKGG